MNTLTQLDIPDRPIRRGKVRDIIDLGDRLLIVATDRISAFDCVMPTPIPLKGRVLTQLSAFWFGILADVVPNHLLELVTDRVPKGLEAHSDALNGRSMICRKADVVPIECVARGYLAGSGWKEYQASGSVCGIALPAGLRQCEALPEPIFTPATKAETGHDENIPFDRACDIAGRDTMTTLRDVSISLYERAADFARKRGVILADTKFEFGHTPDGLILIDEALTPDSSRYWPADKYEPGRDQESFDKQFVRNFLQGLCDAGKWDKTDPAPALPADVVRATTDRYVEAFRLLTGRDL
ncbi:MAG: phosphoribosylaminoimidazolesuccinocarboxamide synthase [Phycisphaerales bacterium]|nr:phosphoribosylaminoimidazolesuccinocarboxamide synthase [Phycisphaerales bacterium]MCB9855654.1 phosphoribosylaminoimidazolesuccinocarboxamide synthase [Phycisphaerales bacterium]MCB9862550.1 phosphoribosylaminoimidazolesuccinocarboxamide synthase [Phycisphaerales bacterium]